MQLRYKDYRDHDQHKVMSLSGEELIRRFLLHILPKRFMHSPGLCGVSEYRADPGSRIGSEYSA